MAPIRRVRRRSVNVYALARVCARRETCCLEISLVPDGLRRLRGVDYGNC